MKELTKFAYFTLGVLFCLVILGAVGLYLYDQIDVKLIIIINELNTTLPSVDAVPL